MPKKPEFNIRSYGIYTRWDADSKELPQIKEFTYSIPGIFDIEFGFIVNIRGAKNQEIDYCIYHPGIKDDKGRERRPFDGSVYVKTNDWDFYLGDTIWPPLDDKLGEWRMTVELDGTIVADKTFIVVRPNA